MAQAGMIVHKTGRRPVSVTRIRIATLVVLLAAYEIVSASGLVFQGAMPSLVSIARALVSICLDPGFYPNLMRTAEEVVAGVVIGSALGIVCGFVLGVSPLWAAIIDPWVRNLAPTPKIVFLPILLLIFGIDAGSKTAMAALSAFFPVVVATYGGMRQVPPILLKVVRSYNAGVLQRVRTVYLPSLSAPVLGSLRLAVGVGFIGALLAEVKMSNQGLGYLVMQDFNRFDTPQMYAVLLIVFALAMLANGAMGAVARRFGVR